ncbi:hypothetical protein [Agromyces lapidis]|uniref:Uncharacterized protein n=1 Tax=Agromyces lapidis TaxID=279574 RepID=A0ABV5SP95_9MICO|nr:hypothetical protein [Agromyces lapidis]
MAGFRVRRRLGAHQLEAHDADLAKRAGAALFAADERVRAAADELGFAEAELGAGAIQQPGEALAEVRRQLGIAFLLNRLNHDAMPGTADEVRARYERVVQLCESAEHVLDEQLTAIAERITRARREPEFIDGLRAELERLRARVPFVGEAIGCLAARYAREALVTVEADAAEAEQLLAFAEHSLRVAERRREAGAREQAQLALEASAESVRRAAAMLDAVEAFEVEALRAESALAAIVEESRRHLAVALDAPPSRSLATAIDELRAALAGLPAGVNTDPFAHLSRVRSAHTALESAMAAARERAMIPTPPVEQVSPAIEAADRRLDVARDAIARNPGRIGAEAMKVLAESERIRTDLGHYLGSPAVTVAVTDHDHQAQVVAMARRAAFLASEALFLARRDIEASRRHALGRGAMSAVS